jgi:hypothetical protein
MIQKYPSCAYQEHQEIVAAPPHATAMQKEPPMLDLQITDH